MMRRIRRNRYKGFTLAELLICLAILGVIATFTIPKVLQSSQNGQKNAITKEAASAISEAFHKYRLTNTVSSSTTIGTLTPYLNYVQVDTTSVIDDCPPWNSWDCSNAAITCLRLHSGAILQYYNTVSFGGTATTNAIWFNIDPDGTYSGVTTGAGKAADFLIYFDGSMTSKAYTRAGSTNNSGLYSTASPVYDPPWFSWN